MKSVFVVFGMCGEYSDRQEWPVKAFVTAEAAQACADRCQAYAKRVKGAEDYHTRREMEAQNPDDPAMSTSYTDTEYSVTEIGMGDDLTPQELASVELKARRAVSLKAITRGEG